MKNAFLTGAAIYLRSLTEADLTSTYRDWFNDSEICKFNSHHRFPNYDQNMQEYYETTIKSHNNLILGICDSKTDRHIGNISLQSIDNLNQSAEFAIIIGDKSFWGKGVGKEAMSLIVAHGFEQLNLHRIYIGTSAENIGMQKLALALGFKEEGRIRDEMFKNGKFQDGLRYGLLREEHRGSKK